MAYPANLVLESSLLDPETNSFSFITALTPEGFPLFEAIHQEEELTAQGVNGRRWRTIFDQNQPFTMETTADSTSYNAAYSVRESHRQARGRFGMLTVTASDQTKIFRVHVIDVQSRCAPARTVGANATNGATAWVVTTWTLVRVPS